MVEFRDNDTKELLWRDSGSIVPQKDTTLIWVDSAGVSRTYKLDDVVKTYTSPVPVGEISNTDCGLDTVVYLTEEV